MFIKKKCIVIFGPEAVGKATVGRQLAQLRDYNILIHEDVKYLTYTTLGSYSKSVCNNIEENLFKAFSKMKINGIVFVFPWNFETSIDRLHVQQRLRDACIMSSNIYYVELTAPIEIRRERNEAIGRQKLKPLKADLNKSRELFEYMETHGRYYSEETEFANKQYIKLDTSSVSAVNTAYNIINEFKL